MSLGMEVGLGPGEFVLDGDPALPPQNGGAAPKFSAHVYCDQTARWIKMALGMEVGLSAVDYGVNGDPAPLPKSFQNFVAKGFIAAPIDVLCSNFVKFGRREIGKVVHYFSDKKRKFRLALQLSTARIAPKICQGKLPRMFSECSRFHPNRFTFGGVISERVSTVRARSKMNPTFG